MKLEPSKGALLLPGEKQKGEREEHVQSLIERGCYSLRGSSSEVSVLELSEQIVKKRSKDYKSGRKVPLKNYSPSPTNDMERKLLKNCEQRCSII